MTEPSSFDFETAISGLEARALKSRRRGKWTLIILIGFVTIFCFGVATTLAYSSQFQQYERFKRLDSQSAYLMSELQEKHIVIVLSLQKIVEEFLSMDFKDFAETAPIILPVLKDLSSLRESLQITRENPEIDPVVSAIQSGVLSIGIVGIAIFVVQICMSFLRYFTQLAELYEAQANALRASGGDIEAAIAFMDKFSPTAVSIGKMPSTIYEKALEAVRDVAKRPPTVGG